MTYNNNCSFNKNQRKILTFSSPINKVVGLYQARNRDLMGVPQTSSSSGLLEAINISGNNMRMIKCMTFLLLILSSVNPRNATSHSSTQHSGMFDFIIKF